MAIMIVFLIKITIILITMIILAASTTFEVVHSQIALDIPGFSAAGAPEEVDLGRSRAPPDSRPPSPVASDLALSRVHLLPLKEVRKMEGHPLVMTDIAIEHGHL